MVRAKQYRLGLLFVHGMGEQERGDTITQMGDALTEWLRRCYDGDSSGSRMTTAVSPVRRDAQLSRFSPS